MSKLFCLLFSAFVVLLLSSCRSIISSGNPEHESKMELVNSQIGFGRNYTPKYFISPMENSANRFTIRRGSVKPGNKQNSSGKIKIAWDSYTPKNTDGSEIPPQFAIVLIPGSAGSYLKYAEYIYDIDKVSGHKTVFYMMDHRGQGLSTWFNPKGRDGFNGLFVDDFDNYIYDLKFFVQNIVKPSVQQLQLKSGEKIPIFIYGHSLGGAIAAKYLQTYPDDFSGAILSSPAIKPLDWLNRTLAYAGIWGMITYGWGAEYVPWGDDIHERLSTQSIFCNTLSDKRWDYWQKISDPGYFLNKNLVHPGAGGEVVRMSYPTFWWTYQLILGTDSINKPENAKKVKVPYLIFTAGKENLVSIDAIDEFLKNTHEGLGRSIDFPNSRHDIMLARDPVRNKSIKEIVSFMKANSFTNQKYLISNAEGDKLAINDEGQFNSKS